MEEILQLKEYLAEHRYEDAMLLVGEMEDMAKDDKITRIGSFAEILLLHLIKQEVEQRTTRSWDDSILRAVEQITRSNKRRKAGGYYFVGDELREALEETYSSALRRASREAFEGEYSPEELQIRFDRENIINKAMTVINNEQTKR